MMKYSQNRDKSFRLYTFLYKLLFVWTHIPMDSFRHIPGLGSNPELCNNETAHDKIRHFNRFSLGRNFG